MSSILDRIKIVRLEEDTPIASFDCGDIDLNDFLHNDSKNYLKSMLAVTYLIKIEEEIAAYFCLSYDGLTRTTILSEEEKALWNRVGRKIPNSKRRKTYPAVKIGRLAVAQQYAGFGIGILFSAVSLLLFQGGITLLVLIIGKDIPPEIISEITAVGGIMLII